MKHLYQGHTAGTIGQDRCLSNQALEPGLFPVGCQKPYPTNKRRKKRQNVSVLLPVYGANPRKDVLLLVLELFWVNP